MNNKLILYKENIFTKISNFFKKLFCKKQISTTEYTDEKITKTKTIYSNFFEDIKIKQNEEEIRLKKLMLQYDNGEIEEEDLSEEDIDKIIQMYEKETEQLNKETENIKIRISQMLKELKHA